MLLFLGPVSSGFLLALRSMCADTGAAHPFAGNGRMPSLPARSQNNSTWDFSSLIPQYSVL